MKKAYKFYYDNEGFHIQELVEYRLSQRISDGKEMINGSLIDEILKNGNYYTYDKVDFEWWKIMVVNDLEFKLAQAKKQVDRITKILRNA